MWVKRMPLTMPASAELIVHTLVCGGPRMVSTPPAPLMVTRTVWVAGAETTNRSPWLVPLMVTALSPPSFSASLTVTPSRDQTATSSSRVTRRSTNQVLSSGLSRVAVVPTVRHAVPSTARSTAIVVPGDPTSISSCPTDLATVRGVAAIVIVIEP